MTNNLTTSEATTLLDDYSPSGSSEAREVAALLHSLTPNGEHVTDSQDAHIRGFFRGYLAAPCTLTKERLDSGGYVDGYYFGHGEPLYLVSCPTSAYSEHVRATSRADAKSKLRAKRLGIRFCR